MGWGPYYLFVSRVFAREIILVLVCEFRRKAPPIRYLLCTLSPMLHLYESCALVGLVRTGPCTGQEDFATAYIHCLLVIRRPRVYIVNKV